jgi:hypothetical protein
MSTSEQPNEEELRAAYEAEIKKIRVEQILLDQIVSLINLGMRRTGLSPGTEDERDLAQVRLSIESVRALLPLIEQTTPAQAAPIRDALSQLQLAFVRLGGTAEPAPAPGAGEPDRPQPQAPPATETPETPETPETEAANPGEPGPAQRSGRLWVPGQ